MPSITMVSEWSATKDDYERNPKTIVKLECATCKKVFYRRAWAQRQSMKNSLGGGPFCSFECRTHKKTEEVKKIISQKQLYVSVLSRGRVGHAVSEETRQKLREVKLGKPATVVDWNIVHTEAERRGLEKYSTMEAPVPDAVYIEDGKLVALEIEKERWESGIRTKMQEYKDHPNKWDKVILVWYLPDGTRMKEWILESGVWKEVV